MHKFFIKLKYFFAITIFPIHYCKLCGCPNGNIICYDCIDNLVITEVDNAKLSQQELLTIDKLYSLYYYVNPLRKILLNYKYKRKINLRWVLGYLFTQKLEGFIESIPDKLDYLVPIPVHRKRKKERGFNHILSLLDYYIATNGKFLINNNIIIKTKYHQQQMGLTKTERQNNLSGTFKVIKPITNKNILVVDDVFTTGATVLEVAKMLKNAGANKVYIVTLFRKI
ncbi:MAG: ComF family protein [Burkholderiales bacterium]|nr:ComF family protein [Burkholderiales bacterium]